MLLDRAGLKKIPLCNPKLNSREALLLRDTALWNGSVSSSSHRSGRDLVVVWLFFSFSLPLCEDLVMEWHQALCFTAVRSKPGEIMMYGIMRIANLPDLIHHIFRTCITP